MISAEDKAKFEVLLKKAGLGCEKITVFGTIRLNVHVTCVGRETAHKWATLLNTVFPGKKNPSGRYTMGSQREQRNLFAKNNAKRLFNWCK